MSGGIAGIDEAGRGPVMGPLVAAAVRVDDDAELQGMDLRDSKRVPADDRPALARRIQERFEVTVRTVAAATIDARREQGSLNEVERDLFVELIDAAAADRVYVDAADVDADRFARTLQARAGPVEVVAEHGADDRYPVVSAASIVAKVERDRRMDAISEELGFDAGSGYPSDPVTVSFLEQWVDAHGELPPYTRSSWRSARRILGADRQRQLSEF